MMLALSLYLIDIGASKIVWTPSSGSIFALNCNNQG